MCFFLYLLVNKVDQLLLFAFITVTNRTIILLLCSFVWLYDHTFVSI